MPALLHTRSGHSIAIDRLSLRDFRAFPVIILFHTSDTIIVIQQIVVCRLQSLNLFLSLYSFRILFHLGNFTIWNG